jgi:membrane associated rhomboid family serine protease
MSPKTGKPRPVFPIIRPSTLFSDNSRGGDPRRRSRPPHRGSTMLLPIGDDDRKLSGPAFVTIGLILANLAVFFLLQQMGANEEFTYGWSLIPREITTGEDLTSPQSLTIQGREVEIPQAPGPTPIYLTILSSIFMHGGFAHLFGNLLYLWIFGDNVEHRFGAIPFLLFYLVSGIAGSAAQIALDPDSVIPNLGASGAISGVLGAYMILFPKNRVHAIFFFRIISIPAIVAIGLWIVFQFISGYGAIMVSEESAGGIAYGAHIGGFFAGMILAAIMRVFIKKERQNVLSRYDEMYGRWR